MDRVNRNLHFIRLLSTVNTPRQRQNLIKLAHRDQILALGELVLNFLLGNIKVESKVNKSLYYRYRRLLRVLGFDGRISWNKRKQAALSLGKTLVLLLQDILPNL